MKIKDYKKIQKILGSLTPEEKAEFIESLKEEDTGKEVTPQNDPKDENPDKVVEQPKEEKETDSQKEVQTSSVNAEDNKVEANPAPQKEVNPVDEQSSTVEVVDEQNNGNEDLRSIDDFVSKKELQDLMKSFEAKYQAVVDEANKAKEELAKAKEENEGLHNKYEKDPFGDMFTEQEPKKKDNKPVESFDDYFEANIKQK